MKKIILLTAMVAVTAILAACQSQPEYCTVKGSIKGVSGWKRLVLQDDYDNFKVIATARIKDGTYEFHPRITAPTHVYLYVKNGLQLRDFILEPGTIVADVDATDENDYELGATGTPANDFCSKAHQVYRSSGKEAYYALWDERIDAGENGILALYYASNVSPSALKGLEALDRLTPEIAAKPFVEKLREELTRRAKTEPAPEGSSNHFIDMEYPDADGNPVSLSSVVNNPANRYVLLDFWATWCSPCRESIPDLQAAYAKYHDKGLEIYSVSEDVNEGNWKKFITDVDMPWIHVRDVNAGRKNSKAWNDYALSGIPTMILIDCNTGEILARANHLDLDEVIPL